jgi:uncharacterized protein with PQ loop repeat
VASHNDGMQEVLRTARTAARSGSTVLLLGESGTGKEVLARFIHRPSERRHGPFIAVNCVALSPTLQIRHMIVLRSSAGISIPYLGVLVIGFVLWFAYGVAVAGDYAFVADGAMVRVIDVRVPTAPVEVASVGVTGWDARAVAVAGNYAFVAAGHPGVWAIRITTPANS